MVPFCEIVHCHAEKKYFLSIALKLNQQINLTLTETKTTNYISIVKIARSGCYNSNLRSCVLVTWLTALHIF